MHIYFETVHKYRKSIVELDLT